MLTKRKLRQTVIELTYRVADLEERLCPCESHQWKMIDYEFVGGTGRGDETAVFKYKCRRCGKAINTIDRFLARSEDDGE